MSLVLLDTSLASVLLPWMSGSPLRLLYADVLRGPHAVALQTEAEVWQGVEEAGWGETRAQQVRGLFDRMLVLVPDRATGRLWGELRASGARGPGATGALPPDAPETFGRGEGDIVVE